MAPQAERIRSPKRRSVRPARDMDPLPEVGRRFASGTERLMASVGSLAVEGAPPWPDPGRRVRALPPGEAWGTPMFPVGAWSEPPCVGRGLRAGIIRSGGRAATASAVGVVGGRAAVVGGVGLRRRYGAD